MAKFQIMVETNDYFVDYLIEKNCEKVVLYIYQKRYIIVIFQYFQILKCSSIATLIKLSFHIYVDIDGEDLINKHFL